MAMMYREESKGWRDCVDRVNQCFATVRLDRSSASSRTQGNLAELDCWRTSTIFDMFQLKLLESNTKVSKIRLTVNRYGHLPLALRMEVNTAHGSLNLIEADVVETLEASARDGSHPMVGNEEIFLPSHEHVLTLSKVAVGEISALRLFGEWFPSGKTGPVMDISLLVGAPFLIASLERVFSTNDLSFKECGQGWVIFCEAYFGSNQNGTRRLDW